MREFDWDKFKDKNNRIAVHCKTIEEAKDFCKQMHEHGMVWCNGDSYLNSNEWERYKSKTCYSSEGCYGVYNYYIKNNYTILEWSDFMKKEFKKADLKYGYLVVLRNGRRAFYMPTIKGDYFDYMSNCCCLSCDLYNENLIYTSNDDNHYCYDVVAVYGYSISGYKTTDSEDLSHRPLLWERKEEPVKEMTMEDLEKHFGCKVKIVKETN
jgi:hypothetical protein